MTSSYGALNAHSAKHCLKPLPCSQGARTVNGHQLTLLTQSLHHLIELGIICLGWFFVIVDWGICNICKCHLGWSFVMALVGPWATNSFFMHLCVHMRVHMYMYDIYAHTHVYIYIYIYIYIHICAYMYIYIYHGCGLTLCMRSCRRMLLYVWGTLDGHP